MAMRKFSHINFAQEFPPTQFASTRTAIGTAVDNQEDFIITQKGVYLEYVQTGTLDTAVFTKGAQGWTFPELGANAEGIEFTQGIQATTTPHSFTIGTDPAFYVSLKFDIPDVSEYDVAAVGFRKLGAYVDVTQVSELGLNADDAAYINCEAGDIKTVTELNNSGSVTTTDLSITNWADGGEHTFKVLVSSAGAVTYQYDGAAATGAVAFTFDTGDVVVPSMVFTATGDTASSAIILVEYLCGYQ